MTLPPNPRRAGALCALLAAAVLAGCAARGVPGTPARCAARRATG
ncbi:hypothetical protein ABXN37_25230 [Piscinibacter sakaiensis]